MAHPYKSAGGRAVARERYAGGGLIKAFTRAVRGEKPKSVDTGVKHGPEPKYYDYDRDDNIRRLEEGLDSGYITGRELELKDLYEARRKDKGLK